MGTDGPRVIPGTKVKSWSWKVVARDVIESTARLAEVRAKGLEFPDGCSLGTNLMVLPDHENDSQALQWSSLAAAGSE